MIRLGIDEAKLSRDIEKASKRFGHTTRQAVAALAVQLGRENAVSTQAYGGQSNKVRPKPENPPKKAQMLAIQADMRNVVIPLVGIKKTRKTVVGMAVDGKLRSKGKIISMPVSRFLSTPQDVIDWVEVRRTRRRGRTPKGTHISELACCSARTFKAALVIKNKKAGMAKGAWLGAADAAAAFAPGVKATGKNLLSYAKKHSHFGTAKKSGNDFNPTITLTNRLRYSSDKNVLSVSEIRKNYYWAAKKVLNEYKMAVRKALK